MISPTLFRAYDIRGIVDETLSANAIFQIGKALGSCAVEENVTEFYVARDGRLSGDFLLKALVEGLSTTGLQVIQLGLVPTPVLYYAVKQSPASAGAILTGSHNPSNYNGLKMVIKGKTLAADDIQALYHRIINQYFVVADNKGTQAIIDIQDDYLKAVTENIKINKPLKIVVDSGNGVTGIIAPKVFRALGVDVTELFCEIDGNFPNHHPDPSDHANLAALIHAVKENHADLGIAFDGDGDRLGIVTADGKIIDPDRLLILFAESILKTNPASTIIYDVKSTHHLALRIAKAGGNPLMWKTGHSLIKTKIAETGALLAGEMSGHFFFNDRWHGFDDAIYAGVRLLELISASEMTPTQIFQQLPESVSTPELKISVADDKKFPLMEQLLQAAHFHEAKNITTIDGIRVNFSEGWGLLRPSNTSPYLIARFEAVNEKVLQKIQQLFSEWIQSVNQELVLPF